MGGQVGRGRNGRRATRCCLLISFGFLLLRFIHRPVVNPRRETSFAGDKMLRHASPTNIRSGGSEEVNPRRETSFAGDEMSRHAPTTNIRSGGSEKLPCPPGYDMPIEGSATVGLSQGESCALQFFSAPIADVDYFENASVEVQHMRNIVKRDRIQLGLFSLTKDGKGLAKWNHLEGQGFAFWATAPFHNYMVAHLQEITSRIPNGSTSYFIINNFDEPQNAGTCSNLHSLQSQHPNVQRGLISLEDRVPVWSMSKVRSCHLDLLIPNPDMFSMVVRNARVGTLMPWKYRQDVVMFRGSTTGKGNAQTNLRAKVVRALHKKDGFDVGLTVAIQGMDPKSVADLIKPKIEAADWSGVKYLLDVDGNAHSFDRPLAIARIGATMLRVNVFTDLFNDGLNAGTHCFDINPSRVEKDAVELLNDLRDNPEKAESAARALHEVHQWLSDDVLVAYLREAMTRYVANVKFVG